MTATNHALTGAVIGLTLGNPLLAVPAAFVSHFILDGIPHFCSSKPEAEWLASGRFKALLIADATLCLLLVLGLGVSRPEHWLVGIACAFVATTPDFMWVGKFIDAQRHRPLRTHNNFLVRLHDRVQWSETPYGALTEIVWFLSAGLTILHLA